jgi:putative transcriptional regulator
VNSLPLRLFRFRPGYVIPQHGHQGTESILILRGTLGDSRNGQRYRTGDLCRNEPGSEHFQDVGTDEPCISLVASEGRVVPKSFLGRVLQRIAGV